MARSSIVTFLSSLVFSFLFAPPILQAADSIPAFTLVSRDGPYEIRDYPALVTAEITLPGNRSDAITAALTLLSDYFQGNNLDNKKLASAKPVFHTEAAPVTAALPNAKTSRTGFDQQWSVALPIPTQSAITTLPKPGDRRIDLIETPPRRVAALVFSGLWSNDNLDLKRNELAKWLKTKGMKPVGDPFFAFYDEFWIPFFWRHNEVLWEIAPQ
jgi:hypothetical protein